MGQLLAAAILAEAVILATARLEATCGPPFYMLFQRLPWAMAPPPCGHATTEEDACATLHYVLIGEVECPLAESVVEPTHVADLPPAAAPAAKRRGTQSVCPECLHRFSNLAKHMGWCCPNLKRKRGNPQGWQINGKWVARQRS